jgi:cyclophilin family peptidyl-prolyl cis-trans isomerase
MNKKIILLLTLATIFFACKNEHSNLKDGLYAEIKTNKGDIIIKLEPEKAPVTVANFVLLAEGKNDYVTNEKLKGKPFYNGLTFHRVVEKFMIQGGDPLGNGSGDAGYRFKDEFSTLSHDRAGTLSMANSGPGTNGSQFFITHVPTPFLDKKHSVFGYVIDKGMETVNKIVQGDVIKSVEIIRKGDKASKFDAKKVFDANHAQELVEQKKQAAFEEEKLKKYLEEYKAAIEPKLAYFKENKADATTLASGLVYKIVKKGSGEKPADGANIKIFYSGFLETGVLFDTSYPKVAQDFGKFDPMRAQQNGYSSIEAIAGAKQGMIPGFLEGMNQLCYGDKAILYIPTNLAYGPAGAGNGVIPPNANLIFEIEVVK